MDVDAVEAVGLPDVPLLEVVAVRDHLRLRRRPGTELRAARPAREVGVRLGVVDLRRGALDAYLPLEGMPGEQQSRGAGSPAAPEPLRESRLVKKTKPRSSTVLSSTIRDEGRPCRSAVDTTIALGSCSPATLRRAEPDQERAHRVGSQVGLSETPVLVLSSPRSDVADLLRRHSGESTDLEPERSDPERPDLAEQTANPRAGVAWGHGWED